MTEIETDLLSIGIFTRKDVWIDPNLPLNVHQPINTNNKIYSLVIILNINLMRLGYSITHDLYYHLLKLEYNALVKLTNDIINLFETIPIQPTTLNFKKLQYNELKTEDIKEICRIFIYYWIEGNFSNNGLIKLKHIFGDIGDGKYYDVGICTDNDIYNMFELFLSSNKPLDIYELHVIECFLTNNIDKVIFPDKIPCKINMVIIAQMMMDLDLDITPIVNNATDILKIATHLSYGDITLMSNTKFDSFSKKTRRQLIKALENVIKIVDIKRHSKKWIKLSHALHVGDYSQKVYDILSEIRSKNNVPTFRSKINSMLRKNNINVVQMLKQQPNVFARSLNNILNKFSNHTDYIIDEFIGIINNVSVNQLLQLQAHLNFLLLQSQSNLKSNRIILPQGNLEKIKSIPLNTNILQSDIVRVISAINSVLFQKYEDLSSIGHVYIDERLSTCPIPNKVRYLQDRNRILPRGTRIPLDLDMDTLRIFLYWLGGNIDMSLMLYNDKFEQSGFISNRASSIEDELYATTNNGYTFDGTSNYIDVNIKKIKNIVRYIVMNVSISDEKIYTFKNHSTCLAGWMKRAGVNTNEPYEPDNINNMYDITANGFCGIPVIFDLKKMEAIWCDLATNSKLKLGSHTVKNESVAINDIFDAIDYNKQMTLYQLFNLHASIRNGILTNDKSKANVVFDLYDGITPLDIDLIKRDYIG